MNFLKILEAILGTAEEIVPVFIHNPASQKIEGVIVSTVTGVLTALGTGSATTSTPAPPAAS